MLGKNILDRQIRTNILFGFLIKALSMIVSIVMVPMVLNYLGKGKYGVWAVILSITQWFVFFDFGLGNGLRNKLALCIANDDDEMANKYVNTTYFFTIFIFIILYIVFFSISFFLDWNSILHLPIDFNEDILLFIQIVFGLIFIRFILQILKNIFFAYQKPALKDLVEFFGQLSILVAVYIISHNGSGSIFEIGVIYTLCPVLVYFMATIIFFSNSQSLELRIKFIEYDFIRPLLSLGIGFLLLQLSSIFLRTSSIFMINFYLGPEITAEFHISKKLISILAIVSTVIFVPYWSAVTNAYNRKDFEWIKLALKRNMLMSTLIAILCFVLAYFSSAIFSVWVAGTNVSNHVIIWVSLYVASFILTQPIITFINGTGKIKQQTIISILIVIFIIPIEIALFKNTSLGISAFIIPPIFFRVSRTYIGWRQLKSEIYN